MDARSVAPCFTNACPASDVTAVFERIAATRMAGLPIVNPVLGVEAPGFQRWAGEWLGVLITPWSISLMLVPGGGAAFTRLQPGEHQSWSFPSGTYDFIANREEHLGDYQLCSLYSPVFEFDSPVTARFTAIASLTALLQAAPTLAHLPSDRIRASPDDAQPDNAAISRRGFLRVMLPGMRA